MENKSLKSVQSTAICLFFLMVNSTSSEAKAYSENAAYRVNYKNLAKNAI